MSGQQPLLLPRHVFIDSSGYLALVSPRDRYHAQATEAANRVGRERWHTYTTNYIIAEAHALFLTRLGRHHALNFLEQFRTSATTVFWIEPDDVERAQQIIQQYADKNFSLTDATSFVLMERHRIGMALTTDRNFAQYGFTMLGV